MAKPCIDIPVEISYTRRFGCKKCVSMENCDYCAVYDTESHNSHTSNYFTPPSMEGESGKKSSWRACEKKNLDKGQIVVAASHGKISLTIDDLRKMRDEPKIPFYVEYNTIHEHGILKNAVIPIYFQFDKLVYENRVQRVIGIELAQNMDFYGKCQWFAKYKTCI
jgi:hypothetical protein